MLLQPPVFKAFSLVSVVSISKQQSIRIRTVEAMDCVRIQQATTISGPNGSKPWSPKPDNITMINSVQYIKLDRRDKSFATFLGLQPPLGKSIGLDHVQRIRNETCISIDTTAASAATSASNLFDGVVPEDNKKKQRITRIVNGSSETMTVAVKLPEVLDSQGKVVAEAMSTTMQRPNDARECVNVVLEASVLRYIIKTCKHYGVNDNTKPYNRKLFSDRPKGTVWVQQRQGFLLRSGSNSIFSPARAERLPKGKGRGRNGILKDTAHSSVDESVASEK